MRINGVLYELNTPLGLSDEKLARQISLGLPVAMTRLIAGSLGSEKLDQQLTEPELDDSNEPLVVDFLRTGLIADLKLSKAASAILTSLERLRPSAYLTEALIVKIAELRKLGQISDQRFERIRNNVATAIAGLRGLSGPALTDATRREIARSRRQSVLLKLRKNNEE